MICYNVLHCNQKAASKLVLECYGICHLKPWAKKQISEGSLACLRPYGWENKELNIATTLPEICISKTDIASKTNILKSSLIVDTYQL